MTTQPRTLAELWRAAGEKPFDAVHFRDASETFHCVAIAPNGLSMGWTRVGHPIWWRGDNAIWLPAPAPKRYVYPALVSASDAHYLVSVDMFPDDEAARKEWGTRFVRLLTDRGVEVP